MSTEQLILIVLISAVVGISSNNDEFQIYRPIISCTLIGLVLGDVKTGVILGGTLELLAIGWMSIGASQAPDISLAGVVSSILVIQGHQNIGAGIAIAVPVAVASQVINIFIYTMLVFIQHKADKYAEKGDLRGIDRCHTLPLVIHASKVALIALAVSLIASAESVQLALDSIPKVITGGLQVSSGFIVVVGYAMIIKSMRANYLMPLFFLGFVIAAFTTFNLLAIGIIGAVLAILYIQLNPKYYSGSKSNDDELEGEPEELVASSLEKN